MSAACRALRGVTILRMADAPMAAGQRGHQRVEPGHQQLPADRPVQTARLLPQHRHRRLPVAVRTWAKTAAPTGFTWFHKYIVNSVVEQGLTAAAPTTLRGKRAVPSPISRWNLPVGSPIRRSGCPAIDREARVRCPSGLLAKPTDKNDKYRQRIGPGAALLCVSRRSLRCRARDQELPCR